MTDNNRLDLNELTAVSPVDGRYARHTAPLRNFVSEYGLIRYRVMVEIEWLKALAASEKFTPLAAFSDQTIDFLDGIVTTFTLEVAMRIKAIEQETNHDVKAVEYYLRETMADRGELTQALPFIHFACTSEDINNLAYSLMLRDAREHCLLTELETIVDALKANAASYAADPMLARTHGQNATPTTVGKEFANVAARLQGQVSGFSAVGLRGKINGAVGNYNAHVVSVPTLDWPAFAAQFVRSLGLQFNPYTTQIEPHDCIAEYADALARINTILLDLCRDIWAYISIGYFTQRKVDNEVGSSTMPHKVNPIDFENAEGNLGLGTAVLEHLARKLPVSRLQRDLTDSTVLRNLGVGLAYTLIACRSLTKGLGKLEINRDALDRDLNEAWEILAEPVQTVMRAHGIVDSYEQLKALTRGQAIDHDKLHAFIDKLAIPDESKAALKALTPATYIGLAEDLARDV